MITKAEAIKLYLEEGRTLKEMCKYLDCVNTITASKRLRKLGIETNRNERIKSASMRGMTDAEFADFLKEKYKTMSMGEIGSEIGLTASGVRKYFVKYGIERRRNTDFLKDPTKTPNWNGGVHMRNGYVEVYAPNHPSARARRYVYEHILVMENAIGRHLNKGEVVHHIDGNKTNNDISNLRLMTNSEHASLHTRMRNGG